MVMTGFGRNTIIFLVFVALAFVVSIGYIWARQEFSPHRFGVKQLALPDGKLVYLKREVGLRYDKTGLSTNGNRCDGPSVGSDYMFVGMDVGAFPIYYSYKQGELTVFGNIASPKGEAWPIAVRGIQLDVGEYARMERDQAIRGVSKMELPLEQLSECDRR